MCDRCSNIDYPIGDPIWLPCGGPARRYSGRQDKGFSDQDTDKMERISNLLRAIQLGRQQPQEPVKKATAFEGAE